MKFLLFFVSFIFSIIFFVFYSLTKGQDIFGNNISNYYYFESFSGNLIIESIVFFLIAIVFLYFFSNIKEKSKGFLDLHKIEFLYSLFYVVFLLLIYFFIWDINLSIIFIITCFIISDSLFNHISNIIYFKKYKINIRYFGLVLNYISSILSGLYIILFEFNLILFSIILFNIFFSLYIHKKYTNYISLLISILSIGFLVYILYFYLFELYSIYL